MTDDLTHYMEACSRLTKENTQLRAERDEARAYGEKLYAEYGDRAVHCVYCGHTYEDGTPVSQDERLTAHIRVCEKHPMRALELKNAEILMSAKAVFNHARMRLVDCDEINVVEEIDEWMEEFGK